MAEYITREEVCKLCDNKKEHCGQEKCPVYKAPTTDAVEVVRCKDCQHAIPYDRMDRKTGYYCHHQKCTFRYGTKWEWLYTPIKEEDDFCSYGERRTANERKAD